ncbi:MAG: hypothetical protein CMN91_00035 [Synechococcus sp. ARS1019]|nr:hypothetical protein [Synechococcus sp. ARS1019]|tara:strand:- start:5533 stop:5745 length:213 start_codon:yes stop_codon:yes gene_type:complete
MPLSDSVQNSLNEATGHIRNALAFAARQERPVTVSAIAKLLSDLEHVEAFDGILDKIDHTLEKHLDDDNI